MTISERQAKYDLILVMLRDMLKDLAETKDLVRQTSEILDRIEQHYVKR